MFDYQSPGNAQLTAKSKAQLLSGQAQLLSGLAQLPSGL